MRKHPLFSSINIIGLALSMSICLLALTIIKDAFTYDRFHPYPGRTYRIIIDLRGDNTHERWATAPMPLANQLREEYPFVEKTTTVYTAISEDVTAAAKTLSLEGAFAEPSFFDVFGFELLYGDKYSAFSKPYSVVLTQETAERFFNKENPVGKILQLKTLGGGYLVAGVIENLGQKSHLDYDMYVSLNTVAGLEAQKKMQPALTNWTNYAAATVYVLVKKETPKASLSNALQKIGATAYKGALPPHVKSIGFDVQNLTSITPGEELINGGNTVSTLSLVGISGVTFLILLLACFNYTNLSLARSLSRAKEVGVRKVIGGSRMQLFLQFIVEAILISLVACFVATAILQGLWQLPAIRQDILQNMQPDVQLYLLFVAFAVFCGILAGSVPAAILSAFKPVEVLTSLSSVKVFKGMGLQKVLVVIQYAVSLVFVIFLVTIYQQTKHLSSFSYGFIQKDVLTIPIDTKNGLLLKNELQKVAGVENVSASSALFGFHPSFNSEVKKEKNEEAVFMDMIFADENLFSLYGLKQVDGSLFSAALPPVQNGIFINEKAAATLHFPDVRSAVGQTVLVQDSLPMFVMGVVRDFNYLNPRLPIGNLVFRFDTSRFNFLSVKVAATRKKSVVAELKRAFHGVSPNSPFAYSWLENELKASRAHSEEFSMVSFLAFMAITIACIGLLGIVTYTTQMKQKEVSIRKVMGASKQAMFVFLARDFVKLLLIAALIALPIGYFISHFFLNEFAYRISVGWGILGFSVCFVLLAGFVTIGSQIIKVVRANPVRYLRQE